MTVQPKPYSPANATCQQVILVLTPLRHLPRARTGPAATRRHAALTHTVPTSLCKRLRDSCLTQLTDNEPGGTKLSHMRRIVASSHCFQGIRSSKDATTPTSQTTQSPLASSCCTCVAQSIASTSKTSNLDLQCPNHISSSSNARRASPPRPTSLFADAILHPPQLPMPCCPIECPALPAKRSRLEMFPPPSDHCMHMQVTHNH